MGAMRITASCRSSRRPGARPGGILPGRSARGDRRPLQLHQRVDERRDGRGMGLRRSGLRAASSITSSSTGSRARPRGRFRFRTMRRTGAICRRCPANPDHRRSQAAQPAQRPIRSRADEAAEPRRTVTFSARSRSLAAAASQRRPKARAADQAPDRQHSSLAGGSWRLQRANFVQRYGRSTLESRLPRRRLARRDRARHGAHLLLECRRDSRSELRPEPAAHLGLILLLRLLVSDRVHGPR